MCAGSAGAAAVGFFAVAWVLGLELGLELGLSDGLVFFGTAFEDCPPSTESSKTWVGMDKGASE
jgi:hypothetical protein